MTRTTRRSFLMTGAALAAGGACFSQSSGNDRDTRAAAVAAEVCVVGGGSAGFVAVIAAARNGANVTLVESFGFPGGMATAGLVGPISKFNFGGKRVVGGGTGGVCLDTSSGPVHGNRSLPEEMWI